MQKCRKNILLTTVFIDNTFSILFTMKKFLEDDVDNDDELFLWYGWPTKGV